MTAITGISGYIGYHLANYLNQTNKKFTGLIKPDTSAADINLLDNSGFKYIFVNFFDADSLTEALKGCNTIVHLIGTIYRPKNMGLDKIHKDVTATLISAAKKSGVKRIVYVSAIGADINAPSEYHRTKAQAEEELKKSGLEYIILRPSLVFGKTHGIRNSKIIARLADTIRNSPFIPVVGSGKNKLQPIFITDLVKCIAESITLTEKNQTIELAGPDIMHFEDIVKTVAKAAGADNKPIIHIPKPVAAVLALIMGKISSCPKITSDQVKMIDKDNILTSDLMERNFKFKLKSMHDSVSSLL